MLFICYIDSSAVVVLIDTWWNVNIAVMSVAVTRIIVLIDTWWNVNLAIPLDTSALTAF